MVKKNTNEKATRKSRVKVGKLTLRKETIKDLASRDKKLIKGGACPQKSNDLTIIGTVEKTLG
jgi:hypothetical protein